MSEQRMAGTLAPSPPTPVPAVQHPETLGSEPPNVVIRAVGGSFDLELGSLRGYSELLYFLVWRDIKVRYKQTLIGAGWALFQPLLTMVIFTVVFGRLAKVPSEGIPYPLFAFTGLLAWSYFSAALSRASVSLVSNANLITKVYFPRLLIPLSALLSPLLDFAITMFLLIALMMWYGVVPGPGAVTLPLFVLMAFLTALAVSLWLSALCVRYRDVGVVIPFIVQVWMFASPVAYPASLVPEGAWRTFYALNPMTAVIDGFRWGLLGSPAPDLALIGASNALILLALWGGLVYFKRMEQVFADVV